MRVSPEFPSDNPALFAPSPSRPRLVLVGPDGAASDAALRPSEVVPASARAALERPPTLADLLAAVEGTVEREPDHRASWATEGESGAEEARSVGSIEEVALEAIASNDLVALEEDTDDGAGTFEANERTGREEAPALDPADAESMHASDRGSGPAPDHGAREPVAYALAEKPSAAEARSDEHVAPDPGPVAPDDPPPALASAALSVARAPLDTGVGRGGDIPELPRETEDVLATKVLPILRDLAGARAASVDALFRGEIAAIEPDDRAHLARAGILAGAVCAPRFSARLRGFRALVGGEEAEPGTLDGVGLDAWLAEILAALEGDPSGAATIRRALRARGVCAFGLVAR